MSNHDKKTRAQLLKEYEAEANKRKTGPPAFEFADFLAERKRNKIDTIYYKDIVGNKYMKIKKGGKTVSTQKINKPKMLVNKRKTFI